MRNDFTCNSILAKMAIQMSPQRAKYKVEKFGGWHNTQLCHMVTVRAVARRRVPSDKIILVGSRHNSSNDGTYVFHSFVVDKSNHIVADSNSSDLDSVYEWVPAKGYFQDGRLIGIPLESITVQEFNEVFFGNKETIPAVQEKSGLVNPFRSKEEAAVDPVMLDNFLYSVYGIFKYVLTQKKPDNTVLQNISEHLDDSRRFLTKYKAGYRNFNRVTDAMLKGVKYNDTVETWVQAFGKDLKSAAQLWVKDNSIPHIQLNMLKSFGTWLRKRDSDNAKNFLLKNVSKTKHAELVKMFADEESLGSKHTELLGNLKKSQADLLKDVRKIVKQLTGKEGEILTIDDAQKVKEKNPELYAKYRKLRRDIFSATKDYLRLMVRKAGVELIDYENFVAQLDHDGVQHKYPKGFQGFIDEEGNFYTVSKKRIAGIPSTQVIMNPAYDPEIDDQYVFRVMSPTKQDEEGGYFYTLEYKKRSTEEKFNKVANLGEELPELRKKWSKMISAKSRDGICAAEIDLIAYFAARIGSVGNMAHGEATFGISTLLVKHVKKKGNTYVFHYPGKKGTPQHHVLNMENPNFKKVSAVLDSMLAGKKPSDRLWTWEGNPIPPSAVSKVWKSLGTITKEVGVHKLRTAEGTKMAKDIIANCPFKKGAVTQSQAEKWYKEEMKKVGNKLQHRSGEKETGMTAIKSYICIDVQKEFFTDLGLRIPAFLQVVRDT